MPMPAYETGYAITQDYLDAGVAIPNELSCVSSALYDVQTDTSRRHLLGLIAAVSLLDQEDSVGYQTVSASLSHQR